MHVPIHDPVKLRGLRDLIRKYCPDRLCLLGDGIEADAASKFESEMNWTLDDEYAELNGVVEGLSRTAKDAELWYFDGNHEDNLGATGRIDRRLRGLIAIDRHVPALKGWKRVPYMNDEKGLLRLGQTVASHGWSAGQNSDNQEAILWCRDRGLSVRAHTHRFTAGPVRVKAGSAYIDRWYVNVGTMADLRFFKERHYGKRLNTSKWGFAPVIVDADEKATASCGRRWHCSQFWFDPL